MRLSCLCEAQECECPYAITIQKVHEDSRIDQLLEGRWEAAVRHPWMSVTKFFWAYTAKRVERKARKFIKQREAQSASIHTVEVPRKGNT